MPKSAPTLANFSSGELDPRLLGRIDIQQYLSGAQTIENMVVEDYGGVMRTPGTYYVAEVKTSSLPTRLIEFEFSTVQTYILEFGHEYIRFYKDSGQILSGGTPYEIVSPYSSSDLFSLQIAQSADTMYIAHKSYAPRKLTRTGDTSWTLTEIDFFQGPMLDENPTTAYTIEPSADTGDGITLTASGHTPFQSTHVGSKWRIKSGYVEITAYTSSTVVTANVLAEADGSAGYLATGPAATDDWAEGAWSDYRGYPSAVAFFEQRLIFGGSTNNPQTIWGSVSQEYENFLAGAEDADAIIYTIASEQVNSIKWLFPSRSLYVGTIGGVGVFSSGSDEIPITPTNVVYKSDISYGVAPIQARRLGYKTEYVQRNTRTIRELGYNFEVDSIQASDVTILSHHITDSGIVDMSVQQSPFSILWCVRSDGKLATFTRQLDEKIAAWSSQETDGTYESVAIIPNGEEDQVWVIVNRTINGSTVRYIEYFKPFDFGTDQNDAFFVHSGLTYDSTSTSTITGLSHLEGEEVAVLADGAVQNNKTVSSGSITLDSSASVVHVGLPYTSTLKTVDLNFGSATGATIGKKKRIYNATIKFYKTIGARYGNGTNMDQIPFRGTDDPMDSPPPLFTGNKIKLFNSGWDNEAVVQIEQQLPLPMTILGIYPLMDTSD